MNTIITVAFTLLSAPTGAIVPNAPVTFEPAAYIEFVADSETEAAQNRAWTQCERFVSAARQANMTGLCALVEAAAE